MKEREKETGVPNRDRVIVSTSATGIGANVLLAAGKAVIGMISGSIAFTLDAVNNLSDALSSVVTIVGTKLAGRKPDAKHPFGHGRIEYFTEMVVAIIILYAGITALVEAIKKIIHPETAEYTVLSIIVISAAIAVKLLLGWFFQKQGKRVRSGALVASGKDALFDAILSLSVLLSAVIFMVFGLSLEAYVGVLISGFIIKAGVEMLVEMVNELVGRRADRELVDLVRNTAMADPAVFGVYDILLHNYGPDRFIGSLHVEISSEMSAEEIDRMERRIAESVYRECGVIIGGVGIYSKNVDDQDARKVETEIMKIVGSHDGVLQVHGFHFDAERKEIHLDVILDFALKNREEEFQKMRREVEEAFPGYRVAMVLDIDA